MCPKNLRLGVVKDNPLVASLFNKLDNLFVVGSEAIPLSNKITERFHLTHQLFIEQLVYLGAPKAVFEFRDPITPAVDRSLLAVQQCLVFPEGVEPPTSVILNNLPQSVQSGTQMPTFTFACIQAYLFI